MRALTRGGQKTHFGDAEAIAEAVQRPDDEVGGDEDRRAARPAGAPPGAAAIGQSAHRHHYQIRAFRSAARFAVRQGLRFLRRRRNPIPRHTARCAVPPLVRVIEGLAEDWRRLDERIGYGSDQIEAIAQQDAGCVRLVSVPGRTPGASGW